ncbi:hypothetical protein SDC9_182404 [bioreactor metagenome]|uniref:Uncharacterized protein n=1 Tax=bioreactor metagenome TaxID=1076179 RepID=A0A645H895_9ZZZZ
MPNADCGADQETDDHDEIDIPSHIDHQHAGDCADEAHRSADGEVNIAAGQNAKEHADREDDHVGVLHDQVVDVLRQEHASFRFDDEEQVHEDERDHHRVLQKK